MLLSNWLLIGSFFILLLVLTKPIGLYLFNVYENHNFLKIFSPLEKRIYSLCGINPVEQNWKEYALSLLIFNFTGIFIVFIIQSVQPYLPLNPQNLPSVPWDLALNTAFSFVTNTNWQAYSGETTMSYFTQMTALTWQNFVSASTGIATFFALARGLTRHSTTNDEVMLGNFWVDLLRSVIFVFLPACIIYAIFLVSQGVIQNFDGPLEISTIEDAKQILPMGPVASQVAIKLLGTNGGGFFNANSAHPFENPNALTNFLEILSALLIPAALTYTYGKMAKNLKHGWSLFVTMFVIAICSVIITMVYEYQPNPLLESLPVIQDQGNLEGKELRFGASGSSLFASLTTDTSCGATNACHDSFSPLAGLVLLSNMLLGEIIFGGVGVGIFGMIIYVIISVFLAGLMVGRTPEYLGKKIEGKEVRFAVFYIALYPLYILFGTSLSLLTPDGLSSINNVGPHGLSEILYAFTSVSHNNGSAFAGLNANTLWYNLLLSVGMFFGRFFPIILGLAIAGSMVRKKTVAVSAGTFETHGVLFICLLVGIILIVGALTFFPVLTLGPITEQILSQHGRVF